MVATEAIADKLDADDNSNDVAEISAKEFDALMDGWGEAVQAHRQFAGFRSQKAGSQTTLRPNNFVFFRLARS